MLTEALICQDQSATPTKRHRTFVMLLIINVDGILVQNTMQIGSCMCLLIPKVILYLHYCISLLLLWSESTWCHFKYFSVCLYVWTDF